MASSSLPVDGQKGKPPSSADAQEKVLLGCHCANYAAGPSRLSAEPPSPSSVLQKAACLGGPRPPGPFVFSLPGAFGQWEVAGQREEESEVGSFCPHSPPHPTPTGPQRLTCVSCLYHLRPEAGSLWLPSMTLLWGPHILLILSSLPTPLQQASSFNVLERSKGSNVPGNNHSCTQRFS